MIHGLFQLLAQADSTGAPTAAPGPGGTAAPSPVGQFLPIAIMLAVVVFLFTSMRSQKKREERERNDMHTRLAKNDRVLTVGGIIGTVMSVKDNEVVVKVDETTNTKMTFLKTSIQRILTDEPTTGLKS